MGTLAPPLLLCPFPQPPPGPLPLAPRPARREAKVSAGSTVHGTEPGHRWVPPARRLCHRPATYLQPASSPRPPGSPCTAS